MHSTIATLAQQHRMVLARLDEVEAGAPGHTATLQQFLAFLGSEVEEHFGLEEEALFPVLARHPHLAAGPVAVMNAEHHEFRALVGELATALRTPGAGRPDPVARAIITLLRAHIDKEDHVLFPLAEDLLTAAELEEVQARAAARGGAASGTR
jgi:hemerythrin-like domain-containing protein